MAATLYVNLSYPKPRESYSKFVKLARTDTTAFQAAWLPKDSILVGAYVIGTAVSNAGTSATISLGTTTSANEIISGFDVKTSGVGYVPVGTTGVGSFFGSKLTADTPVYAKYTESGTASSSGGTWLVKLEYIVPGPGEDTQM